MLPARRPCRVKARILNFGNHLRREAVKKIASSIAYSALAGTSLVLAFFLTLVSSAGAQVTLLYNFGTHSGDPAHPNYPGFIVQGRDGNLYSTSNDGGTDN